MTDDLNIYSHRIKDFVPTEGEEAKDKLDGPSIRSNVGIGGGAYNNNNKPKLCKFCGQPIVFQKFEIARILHPHSMFQWRRVVERSCWIAFDYESGIQHTHNNKEQVAT